MLNSRDDFARSAASSRSEISGFRRNEGDDQGGASLQRPANNRGLGGDERGGALDLD